MRDPNALATDLLDRRLAASHAPEDSTSASRIAHAAQLADRGDHAAAAREAAELIGAEVYDVRLIGFYLFGVFLQRGAPCLPAALGRVATLVTDELAALRPTRRKLPVVSSATTWLFENLSARLQFHTQQRDATWESWRDASSAALVDDIVAGCARLTLALEAVIDAPQAATSLARIRRWANDDLRRALVRRDAPALPTPGSSPARVEPAPPDDGRDDPPDDHGPDEPGLADPPDVRPARRPAGPPAPPVTTRGPRSGRPPSPAAAPEPAVAVGSPALAALQAKLAGFQDLVARGELAKAAVVASDVRALLANFDPVVFFPAIFAGYFKALHHVVDELTPYLDSADQPAWHALDSYYRADMHGFFDD